MHYPAPIPNPFEKHQIREAGSALRWAEVAATLRAAGRGGGGEQTAEGLLGPPLEYTLRPGDVLYVPRGCLHATSTLDSEDASMHLTVGVEAMWGTSSTALLVTRMVEFTLTLTLTLPHP